MDMTGRQIHTQTIGSDRTHVHISPSPGIYIVQVETPSASLSEKLFIN